MKRSLPLFAAAALAALFGCGEQGRGPRHIRLSLALPEGSAWHQGAAKWKELVEDRTRGRYAVEIIPDAARSEGDPATEFRMVRQGALDACLQSAISLANVDPRWAVFTFPWLFPDHATADAVCDGAVGEEMLELLRDSNVVGLAQGADGFHHVTNSLRPLRLPDDLKGLRLAIPKGLPPKLFEHFGASARPTPLAELLPAFERKELDGQSGPLHLIAAAKLHQAQQHLALWHWVYAPIVLCINRDLWYSLPGEDQRTLRQCAREAMAFQSRLVAQAEEALPARLQAEGVAVTRLTDIERDAARISVQASLRGDFESLVGKDLLARLEAAVKRAREKAAAGDDEDESLKQP